MHYRRAFIKQVREKELYFGIGKNKQTIPS